MDSPDQLGNLVEYLVYFRHHVDTVDVELVADRAAQRSVQHRTPFRGVDDLAAEHRLDRVLQANLFGQGYQKTTGFVGDQVFE